ncbi:ATPase, T2SS/T4P/T4SS family [Sphingomonas pituitosa]|uniref:ATPase, T2SS/T4P/T4SS family n=1 Tax=Sphingomonas pituitosa TaxID=99597 RepID=UPI00082D6761|nr:ATPase, T2SS/T4P/T4SS family [Sphingomonas pituitosa]
MPITVEQHARTAGDAMRAGKCGSLDLDALLAEAAQLEVSHLHIEPSAHGASLFFRASGLIHPFRELSPGEGDALLAQVAAAAGLSTSAPTVQHGTLRWAGELLDVFLLPVVRGHRVVLRRSPRQPGHRELEALGMSAVLANDARAVLERSGLVLVAAPAGHGRSTTLRTLLTLAVSRTRPGLALATGVTPDMLGVTWADAGAVPAGEALRAGIDQDFDVLMIDSLEDRAGAAAAVQAAQAGRLVLAGVEAGDAVAAIQQMRQWRVEAFHLASALGLVLAQRLVRRLCADCREPVQATGSVSALLGFDPGAIVYASAGCAACEGTGFVGQIGVFESIRGDATIRRLVNDGGDAAILARHAFVRTPNLGSAARALARAGMTTPEEAVRISRG